MCSRWEIFEHEVIDEKIESIEIASYMLSNDKILKYFIKLIQYEKVKINTNMVTFMKKPK